MYFARNIAISSTKKRREIEFSTKDLGDGRVTSGLEIN